MSEWTMVSVVVTLVGLIIAIGTPILKLNTSITRLIEHLNHLENMFSIFEQDNDNSHKRIWNHNDEQDTQLKDHEHRLTVLEQRKEK